LDLIDSERRVKYKLYRYHCLHVNYFIKQHGVDYVKDVRMLGRDLTNLMILDSNAVNFSLTPSHGIVLNWNGSERDRKLMDLCQILTDIFKDVQIDVTQNIPVEELIGSRSAEIDNLQNAKAKIRRRVR
jgi:TFIIF-interacting CTD phosphatase-like protein